MTIEPPDQGPLPEVMPLPPEASELAATLPGHIEAARKLVARALEEIPAQHPVHLDLIAISESLGFAAAHLETIKSLSPPETKSLAPSPRTQPD